MSVSTPVSVTSDVFDRGEFTGAIEQSDALRQSLAETHSNPINIWNTSDEERAELLAEYLDALEPVAPDPQLIPLDDAGCVETWEQQ